jgi:hypothetical protein
MYFVELKGGSLRTFDIASVMSEGGVLVLEH